MKFVYTPRQLIRRMKHLLKRAFSKNSSSYISSTAFVDSSSTLAPYVTLYGNAKVIESDISSFTYIQPNSTIFKSTIGKFCSIAEGVKIGLAEHPLFMISTSPVFYDNSQDLPLFLTDRSLKYGSDALTIVGSDVWIGQNTIIKSGVSIGTGAVIGAGSIVTHDVPPYAIHAGNPAKLIRMRFSGEIYNRLVESNWWDLDHNVLAQYSDYFENPDKFLAALVKDGHI